MCTVRATARKSIARVALSSTAVMPHRRMTRRERGKRMFETTEWNSRPIREVLHCPFTCACLTLCGCPINRTRKLKCRISYQSAGDRSHNTLSPRCKANSSPRDRVCPEAHDPYAACRRPERYRHQQVRRCLTSSPPRQRPVVSFAQCLPPFKAIWRGHGPIFKGAGSPKLRPPDREEAPPSSRPRFIWCPSPL